MKGRERNRATGRPLNQVSISARSSSVMPVELLIGITRDTTTCW